MDTALIEENGKTPRKTIIGNGGACTLDYMSSGKYIAWSVKPATSLIYTFSGSISVYTASTGALRGGGVCIGGGVGTESGIVDVARLGLRSGTVYRAVFTGTAIDFIGKRFYVNAGATLNFTYYK